MLFKKKKYIVLMFLTAFMVFYTHISSYADENSDPVFIDGNRAIRTIAENTPAGVNIGAPVAATDADNDILTYSKGGVDGTAVSIDTATGQIQTKAALDYETKNIYHFTVFVDDGNGGRSVILVTINVTDVDETPPNTAPLFTDGTSTTRTIAENTAAGTNIGTAIAATDADNDTLTYSLGGTDAASFSIVATSGQLQRRAALDYETKSSYAVTVSVSDGNGGSGSISVTVNVTDVNEVPSFPTETATLSVAENTASGINIGAPFQATDPDGDTLTYSLHRGDAGAFRIDPTTGQLRTHAALDFETKQVYNNLAIRATDSTGSFDAIFVTINVTDVNENRAPAFSEGNSTTRSIAENTASGVNIGSAVSATDADNDGLTYTLGGTDAAAFRIASTSGQLQTRAALDYETKTSYSVTVTASDGSLTATIPVTITVTNVNETPSFPTETATLSVAENTASGINIGAPFQATDPDRDTLTYSLHRGDASAFRINPTTGQLRTHAVLDFETKQVYNNLAIRATDSNGKFDAIFVTINVTDVVENRAPVFSDGTSATRSVAENTAAGTNIGTAIAATDADNDALTYSLGGTDAGSFRIVSTSGQLQRRAALDYETKSSYAVTVSVSDGNGESDSISVTVNVTDVNEKPNFPTETATVSVAENTARGTNIGAPFQATDPDSGDTLTYSLHRGDAGMFRINTRTGQLRTHMPLDFETKKIYNNLAIRATDSKGSINAIAVTVNITDVDENRAPAFTDGNSTTRAIAENTASGVNIGSAVSATDADTGDTLTYTLGGTDASSFSIVATSGQLRTKAALDYETKSSYAVTVSVSDGNGGSDSITVIINVTDVNENRAPTFTEGASTTRSITENAASGTNIGTAIAATDPDTGDTLTCSLGGTDAASFSIVDTSGQLQTKAALDYETKSSYAVTVSVSDGNGGTDSIPVTINVTDVNEKPSFGISGRVILTVAENTTSGEAVGDPFQATDPDSGDTLTYSLHRGDAGAFRIDASTGQLRTHAPLDFETKKVYNNLAIRATDSKGSFDAILVTINVTNVNEVPVFTNGSSTTLTIAENTAAGTNIGTPIAATDADSGDTLTYSLSGADASSFSIVSTSGQLQTKAALDYDIKNSYSVTVSVSDGNGGSASIDVTIGVTDLENNAPMFSDGTSTTRAVVENTASGQNIGTVVAATDADDDPLTYTLGGTDASSFSIVATSGQLQTSAALDYETKSSYSVTVSVSDSKSGTNSIDVTINVTDVNDAPVFADGDRTTRSAPEDAIVFDNIGSPVAATDQDGDRLTYTLGGTDAASFNIDSTNGQLKAKAVLDFETKTTYTVTITVSDGNGGTDSIDVTINITNANDPPVFNEGEHATRSIAENTPFGIDLGDPIAATDPDTATGDTLIYILRYVEGDKTFFNVNTATGQLSTKVALDFETRSSYEFELDVIDQKGPDNVIAGYADVIKVTVNVIDVNDAPVFTEGATTTRTIAENTAAGQNIGTPVAATDQDRSGEGNAKDTLTYSLGGTDADSFSIVSTSGQLQTKAALDRETKNAYSVTVSVSDGNGGSDTIDVTIHIKDIDDNNVPVFSDGTSTTRAIAENTASDTNIGSAVGATDLDNDTLTYSLGGTDAASFSIVSTSGQLQTRAALDYETKASYSVTVSVSDGNGGNDSISVTINVTDIDETPITPLSERTRQVRDAIVLAARVNSAADVTAAHLAAITSLDLRYKRITSLKAGDFSGLTALTVLRLRGNNSISDISALEGLTNLTFLELSKNSISDISVLEHLTELTTLDLDNNAISDISILEHLTELTTLRLSRNSISDISILEHLTELTTLDLDNNAISDISVLEHLTELTTLDLNKNSISDISILEHLTELTTLDLNNNAISDISALGKLTKLTMLRLSDTSISDISALEDLTKLTTLDLKNNSISDISALEHLTSLASLTLLGNPISDYEPLRRLVAAIEAAGRSLTLDITIPAPAAAPSIQVSPVIPDNTALLTNFPNPFNPETWIPYQLAKPSDVTITIYDIRGRVVRTLVLGTQPAGLYRSRSKAAYWDGRNHLGEKVATDVYFYTLKAGDYMATRKLLIRK